MKKLEVSNIKCGGCEKMIKSSLEKLGAKNVKVDVINQIISFDGDVKKVRKKLSKLGYPEADSKEVKKFSKKAKSYLSCALGRLKK